DGAGRTEGFIPDGQLCSGGTGGPYDFTGFNLPRDDWPFTHVSAGAQMQFRYNAWAAHPGEFRSYITKDG
ncbi:lytic polysaccharide monooxygenase, partial [Streptomyces daliensis]|nr:lytic polysaccharide monooxygenase [Streptomyces daliensis]